MHLTPVRRPPGHACVACQAVLLEYFAVGAGRRLGDPGGGEAVDPVVWVVAGWGDDGVEAGPVDVSGQASRMWSMEPWGRAAKGGWLKTSP